jgi:elongation factor Ts
MAEITAAMVQELREATNLGMMECKRALVEAGGDKEKAIKFLRERGMAIAAKKATRTANKGVVSTTCAADGSTGAMVEINCETDFVAKNEKFQAFVQQMTAKALSLDGSLADAGKAEVAVQVAAIGENIVIRRNLRYAVQGAGMVISYTHLGGKIGVLLELGCNLAATAGQPAFKDLARDLTLHIAACNPPYRVREDVPEAVLAGEREIYAKQVSNKPKQIIDKIVDGKMVKYYSQVCLLEQPFVKDQNITIVKLLEAKGKDLADTLTVRRFARYQLGE